MIKQVRRKRVNGTGARPRLVVFRSLKHTYAQLINDENQKTLFTVSSLSKQVREGLKSEKGKVSSAKIIGKVLAAEAIKSNIKKIVFDRGNYLYHGRVKAVAEGAREGGLEF